MIKITSLIAVLVLIVVLMSANGAVAGSRGHSLPLPASLTSHAKATNSSIDRSYEARLVASLVLADDDEPDHDADDPAPTPEPSTLISFGTALLIGGGVLYFRRARSDKK
jgi:hypothetical protein